MQISLPTLIAILAMACVTYATRISGLAFMSRVKLSKRMEAWLRYIPGTILVSLVAPTVLTDGPAEALAALATALIAWRTRNLLLAMLVGVGVVLILRVSGLK
jgi:uncharacterized membrane protein